MKVIPILVGHTQKYQKRKKIVPSKIKNRYFLMYVQSSNMNFYGNLGLQKISDFTSCF